MSPATRAPIARICLLAAAVAVAGACASAAARRDPIVRKYAAYRTDSPITIDGRLDEPIWKQAPATRAFVRHQDGERAQFETTGQVVYDRDAIYIAFRCQEPRGADLRRQIAASEGYQYFRDDAVELFFDPQATRLRYFQWIISAGGAGVSGYNGDLNADLPFQVKTVVGDDEWTMEVRIPFDDFGQRPEPGDRWGMNLNRTRRPKPGDDREEALAWSPTMAGYRIPGKFGYLTFGGLPGQPPPLDPPSQEMTRRILDQVEKEAEGEWRWTEADVSPEARSARAEQLLALNTLVSRFVADLVTYVRPPIRDEQILPWTVPAREEIGRAIEVTACPGEFEPATFAVFALKDLSNVTAAVGPLETAAGKRLPPSAVELFQVVRWYQRAPGSNARTLSAELLLKRSDLVTVDPATRTNKLSFTGEMAPRDADRLEPVAIPAFESQQFWLAFHIPDDAAAGDYRGSVEVRVAGKWAATIPLRVTVLDFELDRSAFLHSLYYPLRAPELETVEQERAFLARVQSEIKDQVDHGINTPSTYICGGTFPSGRNGLEAVIEMQRAAGVSDDAPLICVTLGVGGQQTEEQLAAVREMVRSTLKFVRKRGRPMVYFQGIDEASGERLRGERPSFQAVHDAGGKVFVACGKDYFDIIGDLLDMPVAGGRPDRELARKVHALGYKILMYADPFSGWERPDTYRRNYGLRLYLGGYDGAMNWAYQSHGEDAWDDFAGHKKSFTYAYPALGRPVDTIQWEGRREGCDDLRYLTTLLNTMKALEAEGKATALVVDTNVWLKTITGNEDFDELRREMIARIQRLRAAGEES